MRLVDFVTNLCDMLFMCELFLVIKKDKIFTLFTLEALLILKIGFKC